MTIHQWLIFYEHVRKESKLKFGIAKINLGLLKSREESKLKFGIAKINLGLLNCLRRVKEDVLIFQRVEYTHKIFCQASVTILQGIVKVEINTLINLSGVLRSLCTKKPREHVKQKFLRAKNCIKHCQVTNDFFLKCCPHGELICN
jgi:hypothetical protein